MLTQLQSTSQTDKILTKDLTHLLAFWSFQAHLGLDQKKVLEVDQLSSHDPGMELVKKLISGQDFLSFFVK